MNFSGGGIFGNQSNQGINNFGMQQGQQGNAPSVLGTNPFASAGTQPNNTFNNPANNFAKPQPNQPNSFSFSNTNTLGGSGGMFGQNNQSGGFFGNNSNNNTNQNFSLSGAPIPTLSRNTGGIFGNSASTNPATFSNNTNSTIPLGFSSNTGTSGCMFGNSNNSFASNSPGSMFAKPSGFSAASPQGPTFNIGNTGVNPNPVNKFTPVKPRNNKIDSKHVVKSVAMLPEN